MEKLEQEDKLRDQHKFQLASFDILTTLGTGTFSRVRLAKNKEDVAAKPIALKMLKKHSLIKLKQTENIYNEKHLLQQWEELPHMIVTSAVQGNGKDELLDYIAAIIHNTRNNGDLFLGASPRASLAIMKTAKAIAAMNGRDFVTPDDIQYVSYPVLNHRIILTPEREMEGFDARDVIDDIIKKIEVPR